MFTPKQNGKLSQKQKLLKYFDVKENSIICKYNTYIELNMDNYKIDDEEISESEDIDSMDSANADDSLSYVYNIPGIFEAFIPEFNEVVEFGFPFKIELCKTDDTVIKNGIVTITYEAGDNLLFAINKDSETDLSIVTKLLDNQVKYLHGNIDKTIMVLWNQIASTRPVKLHHIELIYTILYGEETDTGFVPTRLGSGVYTKQNAIGSKDSAHEFGTTNAYNYGYSNDAILKNVTRTPGNEPPKSDLEKIIAAEYHTLPIEGSL